MSLQSQFRNADFKALLETRRRELMEQTMRAGDYIRDIQGGRLDQDACLTFLGMKDDTQVARTAHAGRKKTSDTPLEASSEALAAFERRQSVIERQLAGLDTSIAAILDVAVKLSADISSAVDMPSSDKEETADGSLVELTERIERIEKNSEPAKIEPVELDLAPVREATKEALASIEKSRSEATEALQDEKRASSEHVERLMTEARQGLEAGCERQVDVLTERVLASALQRTTDELPALLAEYVAKVTPPQMPEAEALPAIDQTAIERIVDDRVEALLPTIQEGARLRPARSEKALVSSHPRFPDAKKLASDLIEKKGPSTTGAIIDAITDKISDVEISARDAGNRFSKMGLQRVVDPSRPSHRLWWVPGTTPPAPYQIA